MTPETRRPIDGAAIVYCPHAFGTPEGKTAHGLVRFTERYEILGVVDPKHAGRSVDSVVEGAMSDLSIWSSIEDAVRSTRSTGHPPTHLVVGLAPDGGRLPAEARTEIRNALGLGLNVDSGLHDFLGDDPALAEAARTNQVMIRDIRKPPSRDELHFFTGDISTVQALKLAVLGTDSAIGKRTTAWLLVHALRQRGIATEMIGTGQTAWLQGARYSLVMDSLINDFVSGEIEHAIVSAWRDVAPRVIVIEGQGSLMNPAYPGGFEILAAGRPDIVTLQHAPGRLDYDGFPGYRIQPLRQQIDVVELLSSRPVVAITINHEGIEPQDIERACASVSGEVDLPAFDVLAHGAGRLAALVTQHLESHENR